LRFQTCTFYSCSTVLPFRRRVHTAGDERFAAYTDVGDRVCSAVRRHHALVPHRSRPHGWRLLPAQEDVQRQHQANQTSRERRQVAAD